MAVVRSRCESSPTKIKETAQVPRIMKLTDVGSAAHEVEPYITDPGWLMQQKFDGTRIQAQWDPATKAICFSNTGEGPCTHSAAALHFAALDAELRPMLEHWITKVTLEGELLIRTGEFVVWDILEGDGPWPATEQRVRMLEEHLAGRWGNDHQFRLVTASPTAWLEDEKFALWEKIKATGVEGAVSKHLTSEYEPGVRTKLWVKHKLVKTADLIVTSVTRTFKPDSTVVKLGSASLAFMGADGQQMPIAAASLIGKDLTIEVGDVVEVNFLYREPGGGLVQPRIVRKRWDAATGDGDKKPAECTEDQFQDYSRQVVR